MIDNFETAEKGTMLWSIRYGWVTVEVIIPESPSPIHVTYVMDGHLKRVSFTSSGREDTQDKNQTLFWDVVEFLPPLKPKRMMTKTAVVYLIPPDLDKFISPIPRYGTLVQVYKEPDEGSSVKLTVFYEKEES
jgi:hypothetical protein